jgi:hypothetical protein
MLYLKVIYYRANCALGITQGCCGFLQTAQQLVMLFWLRWLPMLLAANSKEND